jgi:hypothetical protein
MKKLVGLCMFTCLVPVLAFADSAGSDWNSSAGFAGTARHQTNMNQADMIAKSASGYYDNVGKTQVYNISTNTIGTMTTETTTINGSSNTVSSLSSSSGSLDASVQLQSLSSSSLLQNRIYDKAP